MEAFFAIHAPHKILDRPLYGEFIYEIKHHHIMLLVVVV